MSVKIIFNDSGANREYNVYQNITSGLASAVVKIDDFAQIFNFVFCKKNRFLYMLSKFYLVNQSKAFKIHKNNDISTWYKYLEKSGFCDFLTKFHDCRGQTNKGQWTKTCFPIGAWFIKWHFHIHLQISALPKE